jgi:DNA-binding response OmpR family regulator
MKRKTNLRVLYVEDDQDSVDMVEITLRFADIDVYQSSSVDHAWKRALTESFDLYLLDGKVKDGATLGLCGKLHEFAPETPILFYSGLAGQSDIHNGLAAGAKEYLVKPYFGNLAETVTRNVRGKGRADVDKDLTLL